ncbi:hypothetical protein ES703_76047 [subsurface metagenome]
MSKKKARSKENNQPGSKGMFYYQKKCFSCGVLIWGSSQKNRKLASKDCYLKMQTHKQDCQSKQSKLNLPGREGEQNQTIRKVSLRGKEK